VGVSPHARSPRVVVKPKKPQATVKPMAKTQHAHPDWTTTQWVRIKAFFYPFYAEKKWRKKILKNIKSVKVFGRRNEKYKKIETRNYKNMVINTCLIWRR